MANSMFDWHATRLIKFLEGKKTYLYRIVGLTFYTKCLSKEYYAHFQCCCTKVNISVEKSTSLNQFWLSFDYYTTIIGSFSCSRGI